MVRVIMGVKGTGKTKQMIELINTAAKNEDGSVVCIEHGSKLTYDIHYQIRLIEAKDYALTSFDMLKGFISGLHAGNYDITFTGWASISGNGDYATRGIFHSTGDSNLGGNIHDERLDALIDEACTLVYDESVPLYAEIEQILLDEAYIAPLYVGRKVEAYNKDVVDGDTIGIYAARAEPFERYDFVDESKRDTDTLYLWQIENY